MSTSSRPDDTLAPALLDAMSAGISLTDLEGRCRFINPAGAALLGYVPDEVTGRHLHSLIHHSHADGSPYPPGECPGSGVLRTGTTARVYDEVYWRRDGTPVPVEYAASPLVERGEIAGVIVAFSDAIERRRTAERLRDETRIVATLQRIGTTLSAELDLQRLVQAITDAGRDLTGAQLGAFFYNVINETGESYTLYALSGADPDAFASFPMPRNTAVFGPTFRGEGIICLDDVTGDPRYGKNAPYGGMPEGHPPLRSYLAAPVVSRSGDVLGGLFFGHERAGMFGEREVRLVAGICAQAAIAVDNARLFRSAQEALRIRDEFFSSLSHELRTPLTSIRGFSQLLSRRVSRLSPQQAERLTEGLASIDGIAVKMTALVDELLDLARLQAGRTLDLNREPCDLLAICRRIIGEQEVASDRHQITLGAGDDRIIGFWDPDRIERVVANLISNAIKYSPEGGQITLTVSRDHTDNANGQVVLEVRDEGIGVPAVDLPRVFERFHRGANVGRIWGTGTGLAVVRQIVERHGGAVDLASTEGAGTTVTVRLPLGAVESLDPEVRAAPDPQLTAPPFLGGTH
jgi:PAS domain S-box-containing protein